MSAEAIIEMAVDLALEEIPAVIQAIEAIQKARTGNLSRAEAVAAARAAVRAAAEAYVDATVPKA